MRNELLIKLKVKKESVEREMQSIVNEWRSLIYKIKKVLVERYEGEFDFSHDKPFYVSNSYVSIFDYDPSGSYRGHKQAIILNDPLDQTFKMYRNAFRMEREDELSFMDWITDLPHTNITFRVNDIMIENLVGYVCCVREHAERVKELRRKYDQYWYKLQEINRQVEGLDSILTNANDCLNGG